MRRALSPVLPSILILLQAQAAKAETITVGPSGSGAQFTQIQDAVDASQPHDTILVLPGSYPGPIWVWTPLRIVGIGEPHLYSQGPGSPTLRIDATGTFEEGDAVLLAGLSITGYGDTYGGVAEGLGVSAPTVLVGCEVSRMGVGPTSVVIDGCSIMEFRAGGSELWINASEIEGWHTLSGGKDPVDHAGTPGAVLEDCLASISRTSILGGDGSVGTWPDAKATGGDGLQVSGGTVVLRGGPGMSVHGGDGAHKEWCGFPCDPPIDLAGGFAITTAGGAIVLVQEDVPLAGGMDGQAGQHAALPDLSAITMSTSTYPTLALADPVLDPGGATSLSLAGEPGSALFGFSPLALTPTSLPQLGGELYLQVGSSVFVPVVLPPSGVLELPLALPPAPALSGLDLLAQLVSRSGGSLLISTPTLLVVR